MKYFLVAAALICAGAQKAQAVDTVRAPIANYGTPAAVALSSNAYTSVVSSTSRAGGLTSILIDVPANLNSGTYAFGHIGGCASTAVSTSSVIGPIQLLPSVNSIEIELAEDACLWMATRSTHTITVQPVSRKR